MPEELSKKIEKNKANIEKPLSDASFSVENEKSEINIEKESEFESSGEGKKSLEKQGEALKKVKKTTQTISDQEREQQRKIEEFLSEGLDDVFLSMSPKKQKQFKVEGEKTISKINHLLTKAKVNAEKIISLIRNWLKIIPGVNKYFLEQEAKIKADKIIKLKK